MEDKFKNLDLNLLRVFEALILESNVSRAAERLHLTQPAVSNALARLRESFGDVLFEKTRNGVAATGHARELWALVQPHYRGMREALAPRSFDAASFSGQIRLAMTDYTIERVMPRLSSHLQEHAPCLRLEIVPYSLAHLTSLFEKEGVEIALGTYLDDSSQRSMFRTHALWAINYGLLVRRGHALAKRPFSMQEFLRARHIDVWTPGMHMGLYDQILAAHGLKRNLVLTLHSFQQALEVIHSCDSVAVLPTSLLDRGRFMRSVIAIEPPIPVPSRELWIIWHQRHAASEVHLWLRTEIIRMFSHYDKSGRESGSASLGGPSRAVKRRVSTSPIRRM